MVKFFIEIAADKIDILGKMWSCLDKCFGRTHWTIEKTPANSVYLTIRDIYDQRDSFMDELDKISLEVYNNSKYIKNNCCMFF